MKTNLKQDQMWNERFQKSIFDLTDEERAILKQESQERKLRRQNESRENSINLCNLSMRRIKELEEIADKSSVNFVHNKNSNSITVFGEFCNIKNFLKNSKISNNANYLLGMKTSY